MGSTTGDAASRWVVPLLLVIVIATLDRLPGLVSQRIAPTPGSDQAVLSLAQPPADAVDMTGVRTVRCSLHRWFDEPTLVVLELRMCAEGDCPPISARVDEGHLEIEVPAASRGATLKADGARPLAIGWPAGRQDSNCTMAVDAERSTALQAVLMRPPPPMEARLSGCAIRDARPDAEGLIRAATEDQPCEVRVELEDPESGLIAVGPPTLVIPVAGEAVVVTPEVPGPSDLAPWPQEKVRALARRLTHLQSMLGPTPSPEALARLESERRRLERIQDARRP